jgi:hypothetical protein
MNVAVANIRSANGATMDATEVRSANGATMDAREVRSANGATMDDREVRSANGATMDAREVRSANGAALGQPGAAPQEYCTPQNSGLKARANRPAVSTEVLGKIQGML